MMSPVRDESPPLVPHDPPDKLLLRDGTDIQRVAVQLFTRWRLPRIEISSHRFPQSARQSAQHRFTRLSEACNCLLGEVLGCFTLIGGFLYCLWAQFPEWATSDRADYWLLGLDWSDVKPVLIGAVSAALLGWLWEMAMIRVRLIRLLRRLHHG